MTEEARQRDKLVGLSVLGMAAFNPPLLNLFGGATVFGWPLLYVYLFAVWGALIAAVALVIERRRRRPESAEPED